MHRKRRSHNIRQGLLRRVPSLPRALFVGLVMVILVGALNACQQDVQGPTDQMGVGSTQHAPEAEGGQVHWTYDGETGAERWGDLDPSFEVCAHGTQQSPVDLASPIPVSLDALDIQWQPAKADMVDNGHTIQVNVPEGSWITLDGRRFSLLQFHFHLPSEHTYEGIRSAMEVHFVHQAAEGDLAVIGVFMDVGEIHPAVESIWDAAPGFGEPSATLPELDPSALLPEDPGYLRYAGSLTTPPCAEVVSWVLMTHAITVSRAQVDAFEARYPMNARPVQRLNRRFVLWPQ